MRRRKPDRRSCFVAIGRRPHTQGLGFEAVGVALDSAGHVETNRISKPILTAFMPLVTLLPPMLAHKAEDEGCFAEHLPANCPCQL